MSDDDQLRTSRPEVLARFESNEVAEQEVFNYIEMFYNKSVDTRSAAS